MNTKIPFILACQAAACVFLSGCVSDAPVPNIPQYNMPQYERPTPRGYVANTYLASTPNGAYILLNGTFVGTTPLANLFARHGDSVAVYKPGYDAVTFLSSEDGQLTANIPLFRSNARYYSLLSGSGAKFVQSGSGVILEATGARAEANSSFVIYDGQYGADIRLTVLEANPLYIRFRSSDGTEFCYPVGENAKMSGMRDERIGISSIPQNGGGFAYPHTPAQFPSIQSGVNSIPQMR